MIGSHPLRRLLLALALLTPLPMAAPARAIETIKLKLPFIQDTFTVKVEELRSPAALLNGNSDLAELNRATNGEIGRKLSALMASPLPVQMRSALRNSMGSALLDQVLLVVSALGEVDGVRQPPIQGSVELEQALQKAARDNKGEVTLVDVLQVVPGQTVTLDLNRFLVAIQRLKQQQQAAVPLVAGTTAASSDGRFSAAGNNQTARRTTSISAAHREAPLELVVVEPTGKGNGKLVMISHGLWDSPANFEGWAEHLASHGYTVVMPVHPGSDKSQQQEMLSGKVPPPGPAELMLRPKDVSAAIDAAGAGKLGLRQPVDTRSVLAAGHSWGATTVLQLAGVRPSSVELKQFCSDVKDPARNLSWVLQCSFLDSADRSGLADPRVKAGVAVSPPMRLLFAPGAGDAMNAQVMVVSGTRDWVVPVGPEAIEPVRNQARSVGIGGNRLVLAEGGDHFNLRAPAGNGESVLNAVILAWFEGGGALPKDGWGNASFPLRDVTSAVAGRPAPATPAAVSPSPSSSSR
ncbi:MAG: alpha/beta fold hydrolase [Cyanobacteriota bacterium]|nr:alpha/beta fold hydrolase [Cyanobacteriota bacterium]